MSGLVAAYDSSDDETQSAPVPTGSISTAVPATGAVEDDDESDDEQLEAQARADAFGLKEANGNAAQKRKDANGKVVIASAPDVLREVCCQVDSGRSLRLIDIGPKPCVFCYYC
jgi:pre-mRNA-processing factor 17